MGEFEDRVFKKGSKTYYNSSAFFPKKVQEDVAKFYSFVRIVDDYVDAIPADKESFYEVKEAYEKDLTLTGDKKRIINNINYITSTYNLPKTEVSAFMNSMEMDLKPKVYQTLDDTLHYIYGSAEVIGIGMSKILGLNDDALKAAQMQGRAMQYINFIRDIDEDNGLGRLYFSQDILSTFGLKDLTKQTAENNKEAFSLFIRQEIERYRLWQKEATKGYKYIPYRQLIAIKTAADMYAWTAEKIYTDPMIVYQRKIKPSKKIIKRTAARNIISCLLYTFS